MAKGYYQNPELTNEKFISNPYDPNEIIYCTGDLGKWLPTGELVCLGRTDSQIKIRGYRVELGDIESHIAKFPGIDKVVVADRLTPDNKKYLCAYYIAEKDISTNDLHKFLGTCLPNYMIPSSYMKLDTFPLTTNHKVNRKALPEPTLTFVTTEEYVEPSNETEKLLCKVISSALEIDKISITSDIFNYSADSLTIIKIQTMLIPYNWKLKTQDFYKLRTINAIAKYIDDNLASTNYVDENIQDEENLYMLNELLTKHPDNYSISFKKEKGYLLTGVTGYLGIHVLSQLLIHTNSDIYCAIREKAGISCDKRIHDTWEYYFPNTKFDDKRIHIVNCDLTKKNFNLSDDKLHDIAQNISSVINCAANVKYYGDYEGHKLINVDAVNNLIDFCINFSIHLNQVSTTGVSGNYLVSQAKPNTTFTENDFYIGQNYLENVYIHSKFEAEKSIYTNKSCGLNYTIFRVGNLTARISDGKFQRNKEENAFYNILNFITKNRILPSELAKQSLEFTPVDICAESLVKLSMLNNNNGKVFHIFNNNLLSVTTLIEFLNSIGIPVKKLSPEEFNQKVVELSINPTTMQSLKAIINDLDNDRGLSFMPSVIQSNKITNAYLKALCIEWPLITFEYIKYFLGFTN